MSDLISKRQAEFIDRAISLQDPSSDEYKKIAYWARVWVQASLPHSDPGDVNVWGRENGRFSLTIQPGMDIRDGREISVGLPYGNIPRLLMSWMCTEAVRTKNPKLILGDNLSDFMKEVGVGTATGGRWGSITRLRAQMERLFEARISYRWRGEQGKSRKPVSIADEDVIWWDERAPKQSALFESYVVLSPDFFREITDRPVPVKLEALRLLKQSPLALDL